MAVNTRGQLVGSIKGEQKVKGSTSIGRPARGIDVTGAEIGQIIRIAEVDESGKPTKWEATDMPDLSDAVKSVNGIEPDEDGNVTFNIPECSVQSVNGVEPDDNGNIEIHIPESKLQSVNGIEPDENGNVEIDTMPDGLEQIAILAEADMLPAIHDASGAILIDENGNVILRY